MNLLAIAFMVAVAAVPMQQEAETAAPPAIDLRAAMDEAVVRLVAEETGATVVWIQDRDPETGRFIAVQEDPERGFLKMLYQDTYSAPELAFTAASIFQMYVDSDFRKLCLENPELDCSTGYPNSVTQDVLMTTAVYAGVKGVQRLAKKYWDVDLDEGWKNLLIFGGLTGVRVLFAADGLSLNNSIREQTQ